MSLGWTLLGAIGQLVLANFMFMPAVFIGGGAASGTSRSKSVLRVLDLSMYLLPALCVLSAGIVICLHGLGGSAMSYGWYAMPLVGRCCTWRTCGRRVGDRQVQGQFPVPRHCGSADRLATIAALPTEGGGGTCRSWSIFFS